MAGPNLVVLEITRVEAAHLAALVTQFSELLAAAPESADEEPCDPAIARLVPTPYPDDPEAAREFRGVTATDLLARRSDDAGLVLGDLASDGVDPRGLTEAEALEPLVIPLDRERVRAWMRTIAAVRLVLASRLGIEREDDHREDDPRFGVYDWLGYRLDGLVRAIEAD